MKRKIDAVTTAELIAWIDSNLGSQARRVQTAADLRDGAAFLLILAKQFPTLIQKSKIILQPEESYEEEHNLRILATTLEKMGDQTLASLAVKIGKVRDSSKQAIFVLDLALGLYSKLSGKYMTKREYIEHCLANKRTTAVPPAKLARQVLTKEEHPQVTDQEITQLCSLSHQTLSSTIPNQKQACKVTNQLNTTVKVEVQDQFLPWIIFRPQVVSNIIKQKQYFPKMQQIDRFSRKLKRIIISHLQTKNIDAESSNQYLSDVQSFNFRSDILYKKVRFNDSMKKREDIKKQCIQLFKSVEFFRSCISLTHILKSLLFMLKYLKRLQKLHSKTMKSKQFFLIYNQNQEQTENQRICQQLYHQNSFWTEHMTVLIGIEIKYIDKGQVRYKYRRYGHLRAKHRQTLRRRLTCFFKRSQPLQETQGFLEAIIKQRQYKNLRELLKGQTANPPQHYQNYNTLRKLITIMLNLKHKSVQETFVKLYDSIIGEIINVKITDIQHSEGRFRIIDGIVGKVRESGREIEEFLMKNYRLEMGEGETEKLLKATVYCFLAELNGFPVNEFYCEAFNLASLKGLSQQVKSE